MPLFRPHSKEEKSPRPITYANPVTDFPFYFHIYSSRIEEIWRKVGRNVDKQASGTASAGTFSRCNVPMHN